MATFFFASWDYASEVAVGDPHQESTIAIGGTSAQGAVITTGTGQSRHRCRVRLFADTKCFVTWGADPTALNDGTDGRPMGVENPEYVDIEAGDRIAVIERA